MRFTNHFNITRLGLLMRMELRKNFKGILITLFVIFGILFIGFVIDNVFNSYSVYDAHNSAYAVFLLLGGFIFSSMSFSDLSSPLKRSIYLMLPASNLEKFLAGWLISCVGWIVLFTLLFIPHTLFINSIGSLFFKNVSFMAFSPLSVIPVNAIMYYIVLQGVFMVGAVNFRGYVFLKTLFTLLIIAAFGGILFYMSVADLAHSNLECSVERCSPTQVKEFCQMWEVIKLVFWWGLAPLCWVLTYVGLKDQEV